MCSGVVVVGRGTTRQAVADRTTTSEVLTIAVVGRPEEIISSSLSWSVSMATRLRQCRWPTWCQAGRRNGYLGRDEYWYQRGLVKKYSQLHNVSKTSHLHCLKCVVYEWELTLKFCSNIENTFRYQLFLYSSDGPGWRYFTCFYVVLAISMVVSTIPGDVLTGAVTVMVAIMFL